MQSTIPFSPLRAPIAVSWTTAKNRVNDRSFLFLASVFAGFLLVFLMTSYYTPVSPLLIQRVRWVGIVVAVVAFAIKRRHAVRSAPLMAAVYLFVALMSSARAEGYAFSLVKLLPMALSMLLSFYLVPAALDFESYRRLLKWVCSIICGLGGLSLAYGVATGQIFALSRYDALYFGPNTEGVYMGMAFFAALWLWGEYPNDRLKIVYQMLVPASLVACYATSSRSSFFGILIGAVAWGATLLVRGQSRRRRQLLVAMMILCVAFVAKRSFFEQGWEMMMRKSESSEEFFASRMWIWEDSWEAFKEKPILGHGYGVSAQVTEAKEISLESSVSVRDGSGYLGLLESLGILGCTAFALLVLQLVLGEIHLLRKRVMNPYVLTSHGMAAMTAFLLVNHIGEPWLLGPGNPTFHLFWFFMAAAFHFNFLARKEDQRRKREAFQQRLAMIEAQRLERFHGFPAALASR